MIGGLLERASATWPLARLEVSASEVLLGPSHRRLPVPTYRFAWDDVEVVQVTPGILGFAGLVFALQRPVPAQRPMFLWPRSAERPCFWIRHPDLADALPRLSSYARIEHTSTRRWW